MLVEKPHSDRRSALRPLILLIASLGAILVTALVMAVDVWSGAGDTGMSMHGYIAMALGIIVTLALGGGLMALVFFSSRRGYDDAAASGDELEDER